MGEKKLIDLQREWYERLKAEGFNDIEHLKNDGNFSQYLRGSGLRERRRSPRKTEDVIQASKEFYSLASEFLHTHEFKKPIEKIIWALFAEGLTYREIAKECGVTLGKVFRTITKLREGPFRSLIKNGE